MKSGGIDNKELSPVRLSSCLFVLLLGATHLSAAVTQKRADVLMKEYLDADQHVYTALERVPVRHWGDRSLAAQFWRLRDEINRKTKAGKRPSHEEMKSFAGQFEQSWSRVLSQLKINTAGTISFSRTGKPVFDATFSKVVVYKDVPTAVVLCLQPSGRSGSIRIVPSSQEGIEIKSDLLNRRAFFKDFSVLAITARCKPGTYDLAIELCANVQKTGSLVSLEVRPSALLKGSLIRRTDKNPVAAKIFVEGDDGRLYVVPGEYNYRTQNWYVYFQLHFSYADRAFSIPLPPGRYHVTAMKGYGYKDAEYDIDLEAGKATNLTVSLEQMKPLEERGWYAADLHMHTKHLSLKMLRSEEINVVADTKYSTEKAVRLR